MAPAYKAPEVDDDQLSSICTKLFGDDELLFHTEELRPLIRKYSQVIQRYCEQYQAGYDGEGLAQMIQTTTVTPEVDDDQPSSNCTKLFGDDFQRCHEGPTQNRFIIAFPLICGHFSDATNDLCFAISYCATIRLGGKGPGKGGSRTSDQMNAIF